MLFLSLWVTKREVSLDKSPLHYLLGSSFCLTFKYTLPWWQLKLKTIYVNILLPMKSESEVAQSCPTLVRPHGLQPTRLLRPWDFLGKKAGVGCHFLLQEIFPTQGLNPGLLHFRQTLYHLSHQGSQMPMWVQITWRACQNFQLLDASPPKL